jgi:hypothetical protein
MNTYQITAAGDGFRIVGAFSGGRRTIVGGFFTEADAEAWLRERRMDGHSAEAMVPAKLPDRTGNN